MNFCEYSLYWLMLRIQLSFSSKFSTDLQQRRKPDISRYHDCEQLILTMFLCILAGGSKTLWLVFWLLQSGPREHSMLQVGPHLQLPIIHRSKHRQECNPQWAMLAVTLGELIWSGIAWSTSALTYGTVPIGLTTHSSLVQKWQEICALSLLSLPRKQGVSMFPQVLWLHL